MKIINKIIIAFIFVLSLGLHGCYEEYTGDFDYSAVYFGEQKPLRTLVTRTGQPELVFKIGVGLGGVRENITGYKVEYMLDPDLLINVDGADKLKLLPANCYTIENDNNFTFDIKQGKIIGDCPVRINKNAFVALQGSLDTTWALPFRLLSTTADTILANKNWTIVAIKYIDEHSGNYYYKGWESADTANSDKVEYSNNDLGKSAARVLTTLSPTGFDMAGMGKINDKIAAADHLKINLENGAVKLETSSNNTNIIEDLGSTYDADTKIFNLKYIYIKSGINYTVNEQLKLRQDVEKELRFEEWN
jgi:hypothetical protein